MRPLVSILIPAYNADKWIAETIESALAQTWPRKEIIVVDDGSHDRTVETARRFRPRGVKVISTENRGPSAARNTAFALSQGDYIQWLDADDLLAPEKIERQLAALAPGDGGRVLLTSSWATFHYRTSRAHYVYNSLCQSLSPVEYLLRMVGEVARTSVNAWLVSREITDLAGPWEVGHWLDEDTEYISRLVVSSEGVRFVAEAMSFYRMTPDSLTHLTISDEARASKAMSTRLRIQRLRALEESGRAKQACLSHLQRVFPYFYPDRPDLAEEFQALAAELGGHLEPPRLRWKYAWMAPMLGRKTAFKAQEALPEFKALWARRWDKLMYNLEKRNAGVTRKPAQDAVQEECKNEE